jgi:hypothetical protein
MVVAEKDVEENDFGFLLSCTTQNFLGWIKKSHRISQES